MRAMLIVALVFAILSKGTIAVFVLIDLIKKRELHRIILLGGLGSVLLGDLFIAFGAAATTIIGSIFWILGWSAVAAGFVWPKLLSAKGKEQAPAAETPAES